MKWICVNCKAINPEFSYSCHNCVKGERVMESDNRHETGNLLEKTISTSKLHEEILKAHLDCMVYGQVIINLENILAEKKPTLFEKLKRWIGWK